MSVVEATPPDAANPADAISSLAVDDLHVAFGGNRVLRGVDLRFTPGFNGLIGPNGAGKTTVFNVISGYVRNSEGAVRLHGEDLLHMSRTQRVKAGIGRTFQAPRLILDATVMENTLLGRHHLFRWGHFAELLAACLSRGERRLKPARSAWTCSTASDWPTWPTRRPVRLSLGSQKLVEVARALVADPTVVLLDEPAAGLGADDVTVLLRGSAPDPSRARPVRDHHRARSATGDQPLPQDQRAPLRRDHLRGQSRARDLRSCGY